MSDDGFSIAVNDVNHRIFCGLCHAPVARRRETDADASDDIGCAACGNWGSIEEVAQIAIEYAKDEAQLMVNRMAQEATRKSKLMTFSGQTEHNKAHRFIVGELEG